MPKQDLESQIEANIQSLPDDDGGVRKRGEYYYDDAHGYEDYDPNGKKDDDESDD